MAISDGVVTALLAMTTLSLLGWRSHPRRQEEGYGR